MQRPAQAALTALTAIGLSLLAGPALAGPTDLPSPITVHISPPVMDGEEPDVVQEQIAETQSAAGETLDHLQTRQCVYVEYEIKDDSLLENQKFDYDGCTPIPLPDPIGDIVEAAAKEAGEILP